MRSAIISSWTLFFGILLFMVGNGLQGVLLGVRAEQLEFGDVMTGFVMGGYFLGYLSGTFVIPKLVSRVGHIRVFGVMAALASASILVHPIVEYASMWMIMRILTGFAYVGMYIVSESWINDKATNSSRGGLLSVYMIVQMLGMMIGQSMLTFGSETGYDMFLAVSIIVSFAAIPIMLTAARSPDFEEPEPASFRRVYYNSPLSVVGMGITGFNAAIVFGMGAVFASKIGMSLTQVSYFMVAIGGGAMILQYPIGKLSDLIDRRTVILIAHSLSLGFLIASYYASSISFLWLGLMMALYSGVSTPLYSLYIAHANDYLSPRQVVSTSAKLVMINGLGAIFGPPVLGYSIYLIGVSAFFSVQIIMHIIMIGFVFYRMYARESMPLEAQGPFVAVRGTSVASSLLPEAEWDGREDDDKTGNVNLT
ncbi:MAG: MFS transporter [Candidatus Puniceispirillales bacterium]